ncbi:GON-4-like protein isoform X2 [Oryzias latipes]|nr:GON-4-like protein isoform X2 [Oryzias latipes]
MERRRPAKEDVCPLDSKLMRKDSTRPATPRGSPAQLGQGEDQPVSDWGGPLEERLSSDDELGRLDIDLDRKSRQHNLTSNNVRTILHEVITHEKVVAMMKAAIMDTKDLPLFEPKMTRSRLKQVVQQEQAHTWSLSLLNPLKPPQFVDINLEEDEDSSDEEYCPDEEEEDTAEETILSDADSLASPLRTHVGSQTNPRNPNAEKPKQSLQSFSGDLRGQEETCTDAALQLVCGPAERSFLEKLGAVDEELACGPTYTYDQSIDRKHVDEDGVDEGSSCLAYRTRSKLPLVNIPLDQLEAELLAPDITADMYDQSSAHRDEDCHWTNWLQSLMAPDCEDEAEDEDDPEYNFLDEPDEPDLEDYRTDRAVQITKKEVNELLEELFDALREEDATAEDEEAPSEILPKFNIPQALRFEAPLASMLTERRQTVRRQYEALQQRRVLQDTTNHPDNSTTQRDTTPPILVLPGLCSTLRLTPVQKLQLQQQMQQHVQLLTQVHLLSRRVSALNLQAVLSKQYLEELQNFACQREELCLPSSFRACNLQGALHLLQEVEQREESPPAPLACAAAKRLLPHMTPATCSHAFPLLPADVAWLFATRPVFLHPELLPVCSLDPALHNRPHRSVYTAGEDRLIVLGLKHFEGAVQADQLMTSYLLCKSRWNVRKHIREMSGSRAPQGNVIQTFVKQGTLPQMTPVCSRVEPGDQRPPVDRNTSSMPNWLQNSQLIIQKNRLDGNHYPLTLPQGCTLRLHPSYLNKSRPPRRVHRRLFTLAHNASLLPLAKAYTDRQVGTQVKEMGGGISCPTPPPLPSPPNPEPITGALSFALRADAMQSPVPLSGRDTTTPSIPCAAVARSPHYIFLPMSTPTTSGTLGSQHAVGQQKHEDVDVGGTTSKFEKLMRQVEDEKTSSLSPATSCRRTEEKEQLLKESEVLDGTEEQLESLAGAGEWGGDIELEDGGDDQKGEGGHREEEGRDGEQEDRGNDQKGEGGHREEEGGDGEQEDRGDDQKGEGGHREEEGRDGEQEDRGNDQKGEGGHREEEGGDGEQEDRGDDQKGEGGHREEEGRDGEQEDRGNDQKGEGGHREEEGGDGEQEDRGDDQKGEGGHREEEGGDGEQEDGGHEDGRDGKKEEGGDGEQGDKDREDQDCQRDEEEEEEEEEDFDDLTQDEDEEEVMSSASEESVLSVPELQETMKQLTWLAAERRLCGDRDSDEDHSPTSPGSQEEEEEEEEGNKDQGSGEGRTIKSSLDKEVLHSKRAPKRGGRCPKRGRDHSRPRRGLRSRRLERRSKDAAKLLLLYDENILDNDPHRDSKDAAFAHSYLNRVCEALQDVPGQVEEFVSLLNKFELVADGQEVVLLFRKLRLILGHRTDLLRDFAAFLRPDQALQCGLLEEQQAFERSRRFLRQLEISFGDNPSLYQKIIKALQTGPDLSSAGIQELKAQMSSLLKGHTHLQAEFWVFFDELRPPPARPGQFEEAHWLQDGDTGEALSLLSGGGASGGFEEVTLPELADEDEGLKIQSMKSRCQRRKMESHRSYKGSVGVSRAAKSLNNLYAHINPAHCEPGEGNQERKEIEDNIQPDQSDASWDDTRHPTDEKEEGSDDKDEEHNNFREKKTEESLPSCSSSYEPSFSAPPDPPVCAKNISLTASGEKVVLWTREADRVILTMCQREGANQSSFQAISSLLGNKTANEVSGRFQDLVRLFRTAARHCTSEDVAPPIEPLTQSE